MARIPNARPVTRKTNVRALVYALEGPEPPYPVYQFSAGRRRIERPGHNPFKEYAQTILGTEDGFELFTETDRDGGFDLEAT